MRLRHLQLINSMTELSSGHIEKSTKDTMTSFEDAYNIVLDHSTDFGKEEVGISEVAGRVLAEDVLADRDYPPFDRATKDGIAIRFSDATNTTPLEIKGIIAAGTPQQRLPSADSCMEIMTGAVMPIDADTVVMYEDIDIAQGLAHLKKQPQKGQNIHLRASDDAKGSVLIKAGKLIAAAEIGILATVGRSVVKVKKLPSVAVISTGNELVDIDQKPLSHQIRRSNAYTLKAALSAQGISAELCHLADDPEQIKKRLAELIRSKDVILLSGGVSKGKFDYIPRVLAELNVDKKFHRVKQRPGKPFWFGRHTEHKTWIFSFPGNPVSTFVNYHIYFNDWLRSSLGLPQRQLNVILQEEVFIKGTLTRFIGVKTTWEDGRLLARTIHTNSSGDLISLGDYDGFIRLDPREQPYIPGEVVPFIPTRSY